MRKDRDTDCLNKQKLGGELLQVCILYHLAIQIKKESDHGKEEKKTV